MLMVRGGKECLFGFFSPRQRRKCTKTNEKIVSNIFNCKRCKFFFPPGSPETNSVPETGILVPTQSRPPPPLQCCCLTVIILVTQPKLLSNSD